MGIYLNYSYHCDMFIVYGLNDKCSVIFHSNYRTRTAESRKFTEHLSHLEFPVAHFTNWKKYLFYY